MRKGTMSRRGLVTVLVIVGIIAAGIEVPGGRAAATSTADLAVVAGLNPSGSGAEATIAGTSALGTNLNQVAGVAVDSVGNVLMADRADGMVDLLAESAQNPGYAVGGQWRIGNLYLLAGDVVGQAPSSSGTPGPLTALDLPAGVNVDPEGNVLIADTGDGDVEVLAENGAQHPYDLHGASWVVGELYVLASGLNQPEAVQPLGRARVFAGDLLVADTSNNEVDLLASSSTNPGFPALGASLSPGTLYPILGGGANAPDACGAVAGTVSLERPDGLAVDDEGNLLFADSGSNNVQVLAISADNPGYLLGSGAAWRPGNDYVIAGSGSHADGSSCPLNVAAVLNAPGEVSIDPVGDVLIADSNGRRIRVLAESGADPGYGVSGAWVRGSAYVVAGGGTTVASASSTVATSTLLSEPVGVSAAADGEVYLSDAGSSQVLALRLAPSLPSSLAATAHAGGVVLSWVAPLADGGAGISGYEVGVYANGASSPITTVATASSEGSFDVTGLADGTTYGFTVAAENAMGTGTSSAEVFATTPTPVAPISTPTTAPTSTPTTVPAANDSGSTGSAPVTTVAPAAALSAPPMAAAAPPISSRKALETPAMRLAAPSATVAASGVLVHVKCSATCQGEAELSETIVVRTGGHRVLKTGVLAASPYRVSGSAPVEIRLRLTSVGLGQLAALRRGVVVTETMTVKGGRTVSAHLRLRAAKAKSEVVRHARTGSGR